MVKHSSEYLSVREKFVNYPIHRYKFQPKYRTDFITSWIVSTLFRAGFKATLFSKNTWMVSPTSPCSRCSNISSSSWSRIRENSFTNCLLCRLYILFTVPGSSILHHSFTSLLKPSENAEWSEQRRRQVYAVVEIRVSEHLLVTFVEGS